MRARAQAAAPHEPRKRLRLEVTGAVQGVGFRPFVRRLAAAEGLGGFVRNTGAGAALEIEGPEPALERFLARLEAELAPPAAIHRRHLTWLPATGEAGFGIAASAESGQRSALVLPDLASCEECLREVFDSADRRHLYPFTTCVHCGPRYSIIAAIPYDRARTAMASFTMCGACQAEYDDPQSRRFHAETNACPDCGPRLALWNPAGDVLASRGDALLLAAGALRQGRILAVKGLGGFQLLVDARNEAAVQRLRARKQRPTKPFAVMVSGLAEVRSFADPSEAETRLLGSAAAPIVLLRARLECAIAGSVAPNNPLLGVMLPATPLHHILTRALGFPVVATSGNRGEAPIASDERAALASLAGIADLFLVHDRPILRPVDDSLVRVIGGRAAILRLARGYAPMPLASPTQTEPILALGGHQKNAVAVAAADRIVLGPHIGDLGGPETRAAFAASAAGMTALHDVEAAVVACDAHPDYHSTRFAATIGPRVVRVPHHLSHVLSGMVDNGIAGPVLGVAWDGTGYGDDATIWGGEFLAVDGERYRRAAHLMPFRLPGGSAAMREPRRAALGALHAIHGDAVFAMTDLAPVAAFGAAERTVLAAMLAGGVNAPLTSSAGRLFDAVASILGLCHISTFEGEAAMAVEFAAARAVHFGPLPAPLLSDTLQVDWRPLLAAIAAAARAGVAAESLAAGFHEALAQSIAAVAARIGTPRVLLTGGCFQNARLTERTLLLLREAGHEPYWHHRVPTNDGGLAVGQAAFAAHPLAPETL